MGDKVAPTVNELLELLDKEIENARAEAQQGGWTAWALTGSFFAVLWLALSTWGEASVQLSMVWKWLLVLSLPVDAFAGALWGWAKQDYHDPGDLKYRRTNDFEPHRLAFGWWSIRAVGLACIASVAGTGVPKWAIIVVSTYYVVAAVSWLGVVLVSFFDFPFKVPHPSEISRALWVSWFVFLAVLAGVEVAYATTIPFIKPGGSIATLALASLLVAAQLLLFRLLYDLKPVRVIPQLLEIRRSLVFGRIDLMTAVHSTEVALLGLRSGSVVEEYLRKLLLQYRRYDRLAANVWRSLADFVARTNVVEGSGNGAPANRDAHVKAAEEQYQKARKLMHRIERMERQLGERSDQFVKLVNEVRGEVPQLLFEWKQGLLLKLSETADREDEAFRATSRRLHEDFKLACDRWQSVKSVVRAESAGAPRIEGPHHE